ncbi:hypothetical protein [Agrobacterium vitis]|uniref:hypothetical protein n=1 Tax=Agrobacterium vitis TaxID=373 RepID=UPI0012E94B46|nr:hypothetical protein [Agrobacterium vitis]MVA50550.1 hypothetical protein [Agrobacterium vitis]NSZ53536.1 hypothetical protein [Agrobacterium vitis]NTA32295.1 hypothetical protein [Agrobacterium vitis]
MPIAVGSGAKLLLDLLYGGKRRANEGWSNFALLEKARLCMVMSRPRAGVFMADQVPTIDEIDSAEKLEAYLSTRPVEEVRILSLRLALRMMPIISDAFNHQSLSIGNVKIALLSLFRANLLSWVHCRFPTLEMIEHLDSAASAASYGAAALRGFSNVAAAAVSVAMDAAAWSGESSAVYFWVSEALGRRKSDLDYALRLVRRDLKALSNMSQVSVLKSGLWYNIRKPNWFEDAEDDFRQSILLMDTHWYTIENWYWDLSGGFPPFSNLREDEKSILIGIATESNAFWDRDPDEVMKDISERLRVEENLSEATVSPPPEPEPGPGPHYDIIDGKLGIVASPPHSDEVNTQTKLFERLCRDIDRLVSAAHKIDNSHPNLAFSIREYAALLDTSLDALDVTGVWSVGGSLAGFAQSFREQNRNRTLAEPLEPEVDGLLQSVVRQHGAFIMGFEEGRDLVDRADQFALDSEKFHGLEESGNPLIAELASNADLVSDDARAVHKSVSDVLHDVGWTIARNCYTGFLTIRNAVRIIIKVVLGNDPNAFAFFGGVSAISTICGDPNVDFLRAAVPFLQANTQNLLAFFQHSPEMHSYIKWVLHIVRNETK